MPIPKYDELMLPLLHIIADAHEWHVTTVGDVLADQLELTDEELEERLPSGTTTTYRNRVHWAKTYLSKAGLIEATRRGYFKITPRGLDLIRRGVERIDKSFLMQFAEFQTFVQRSKSPKIAPNYDEPSDESTPEEEIDVLYQYLRTALADALLETVLKLTSGAFERLVVDLLLAMGYGSSLESGQRVGRSGDGGIDGVIYEDKLGLDIIYVQAKRWSPDRKVGRPDVQAFVGSLMGVGATKGVFITTSTFSPYAVEYVQTIPNMKVTLVDGERLAQLMIEHNVGVTVQKTYVLKQLDENYFPEA